MLPSVTLDTRAVKRAGREAFPGFRLEVLARTPSTQDRVRRAAVAGAAAGYCCVAAEQTAGRGRQGRTWAAAPGTALLVSLLLRPQGPLGLVPLAAGLAVADSIRDCGVDAVLKWPNDVLVTGRKIAGILAELEPRAPAQPAVVLGVGLNLSVTAFPEDAVATSLHEHGVAPPWTEMLALLLTHLRARTDELAADPAGIRAAWTDRAAGMGSAVVVAAPTGRVEGIATAIDEDGALLLETTAGPRRVLAGDVHVVRNGV